MCAGAVLDLRLGKARVALGTAAHFKDSLLREGTFPSVFPPGGSSPLGALGYVNAALELAEQVAAGVCPEPDVIYVASGTMGTCVGLSVGLSLTPLKSKVVGVAVTRPPYTSAAKAVALHGSITRLLESLTPALREKFAPLEECFELREGFVGPDYALYTEAGMEAVGLARAEAGLKLEGTYTGKALAAALSDGRAGRLSGKRVMFWNTYSGVDFSGLIAGLDYHALPQVLHRFFEEPVQPLDRE
jgi:D-cysteine desulfhydrase